MTILWFINILVHNTKVTTLNSKIIIDMAQNYYLLNVIVETKNINIQLNKDKYKNLVVHNRLKNKILRIQDHSHF